MGYFFANDTKKEYWNNWAKIENAIIPNSISAVINSSNKITFLFGSISCGPGAILHDIQEVYDRFNQYTGILSLSPEVGDNKKEVFIDNPKYV